MKFTNDDMINDVSDIIINTRDSVEMRKLLRLNICQMSMVLLVILL